MSTTDYAYARSLTFINKRSLLLFDSRYKIGDRTCKMKRSLLSQFEPANNGAIALREDRVGKFR
ncbi:MAG: hypothetical protein V7L14_29885 [Nostoc sp.]|uniref:hypothetical protein n=1 Tax=Nostoc sp. TaxID=1180 RepID=UPI002FFD2F59